MDYQFNTTPGTFTADLAAAAAEQNMPQGVQAAIGAGWAATDQGLGNYEVSAATGDYWTVVRVAGVKKADVG